MAPRVMGGQHWGALPKVALPIATATPLSISRHVAREDKAQVTTNVQAGKQAGELRNSSQTISWPRTIKEVQILASL